MSTSLNTQIVMTDLLRPAHGAVWPRGPAMDYFPRRRPSPLLAAPPALSVVLILPHRPSRQVGYSRETAADKGSGPPQERAARETRGPRARTSQAAQAPVKGANSRWY